MALGRNTLAQMAADNDPRDVTEGMLKVAAAMFGQIKGEEARAQQCLVLAEQARQKVIYEKASARRAAIGMPDLMDAADLEALAKQFGQIPGYKDAKQQAEQCLQDAENVRENAYNDAVKAMQEAGRSSYKWREAVQMLAREGLNGYRDVEELRKQAEQRRKERENAEEKERKAKERKNKRLTVTFVLVVLIACVVGWFVVTRVIPENKYQQAVALRENGQYEEAIAAFAELGDYSDAAAQITDIMEIKYQRAVALRENGQYDEAVAAFAELGDYSDAKIQIEIMSASSNTKVVAFGGAEITVMAMMNDDGVITYLTVDASSQTPGFGQRCEEEAFTSQFIGKKVPLTLGVDIDAMTSATVTSQAVVDAVNSLYEMKTAGVKTAKAFGFGGAEITVYVTDENGVITSLTVDASSQTPGFGQRCEEEAFTSQFIGKKVPLTLGVDIDAMTSATVTSQAVVDAVNSLYEMKTAGVKTAKAFGFGGAEITVYVTDENGVITSLTVDASTQTAGLGQNCANEDFTVQFLGKRAPFIVNKDATEKSTETVIDAVASATHTSRAVVDAVNSLYAGESAPAATGEKMFEGQRAIPSVNGWEGSVEVEVTVDANYIITALRVDASSQTAGLGQRCEEEAFTSQFIGKKCR